MFNFKRISNLFSYSSSFSYLAKPFTTVKSLKDDIFTVSLIGRPNVGKSSLFNRLAGGKYAITDSMPGLTRDRKEIVTDSLGVPVRFVDTAGWENEKEVKDSIIKKKMMDQTANALIYTYLALLLIDARAGVTADDKILANWLRRRLSNKNEVSKPKTVDDIKVKKVVLVANKAENEINDAAILSEAYSLGLGDPLLISAEHGDGISDLIAKIQSEIPTEKFDAYEERKLKRIERHLEIREKLKQELAELKEKSENPEFINIAEWEAEFDSFNKNPEFNSDLDSDNDINPEETLINPNTQSEGRGVTTNNPLKKRTIQISIVGRPNVGKSTLVNSLLKENRVIADDLPGTTRDSIAVEWVYKGRKIRLVDTAGIDRKIKLKTSVEKQMQADTLRAIRYSHVVICLIDALDAFRVQDMTVARHVIDEGRGLVVCVNKWDLVTEEWKSKASKFMYKQVEKFLGENKEIPLHFISALTNYKTTKVMDEVLNTYERWNSRISTGLLNDWLTRFKKRDNLPTSDGDALKIRFIAQIKSRPPTFTIFVNDKNLFKPNYLKFMKRNLSEEFGLDGVPIRFYIRDTAFKNMKKQLRANQPRRKSLRQIILKKKRLTSFASQKLGKIPK